MNAFIFPGQGAQFSGMGLDMYEKSNLAQELFEKANDILGFSITDIMFQGSAEDLKQTKVTQPAIFLHSVILGKMMGKDFKPDMVAGHSLGEFSALVSNGALSFEDGLSLVSQRATAMQKACELVPSTMAVVLRLADEVVEKICEETEGIVVPANYNCPGQLVISGEIEAVNRACEALKAAGARRAMILPVGGAFHSPLMEPAREELAAAIENTNFSKPSCPIYQNVTTTAVVNVDEIKQNLISQLTAP
ncbi:MAG: ACP S-malonyltransferase, partial [Eudoraea sp.]